MALREQVIRAKPAVVRITGTVRQRLETVLFHRYPTKEWATLFRFGTCEAAEGMVVTIVDLIEPNDGDLDPATAIVRFTEPYSLRGALEKEKCGLCVGVIHSHPQDYGVGPSSLDDDMDNYFSRYFPDFGSETAYFSLIFAKSSDGIVQFSGRGWNKGQTFEVKDLLTIGNTELQREPAYRPPLVRARKTDEYRARFEQVYGDEAAERLHNAKVTIIGTSGTGSPAAHVLARAGVENFVLVDPQRLDKSNLERLHGSEAAHFASGKEAPFKVSVVRDLIKAINPDAHVTCVAGNILQPLALAHVLGSDLIICCTDTNHSRTAISEFAYRYLVPAIDVGVVFESKNGLVTGEIGRVTVYSPGLPCAYCLGLVDPWGATVELMSDEEKERRRREARLAEERGDNADHYWKDLPEIPTVGHFTSMVGSLAASYAIGWLTGKFAPPHPYLEFNILAPQFGCIGFSAPSETACYCQRLIGHADQAAYACLVSAPPHWPVAKLV